MTHKVSLNNLVLDYEEVYFDTIHNHIKEAGLTVEPWQQAYEGSPEYYTRGVTENNISMQDSLHLYRIDPSKCSASVRVQQRGNVLLLKSNGYCKAGIEYACRTNRSSAPGQPIDRIGTDTPTLEAYATRAEAVMLPYHWKVLSASQIDRDLYGARHGKVVGESSSTAPRVLWVGLSAYDGALSF
ncbi:hypothetical protein SPFM9_00248 [Salmonella phage SPFM9]|nr:hypothetical protein SPFM9_00248 [Salmonella phage SPFM9]